MYQIINNKTYEPKSREMSGSEVIEKWNSLESAKGLVITDINGNCFEVVSLFPYGFDLNRILL